MSDRKQISKERADWLLDAVACATQDRRFLRGDEQYDAVAGEAILLNGAKALETAIASAMGTSVEVVGRAIAEADGEDYMEDCERYDKRARFAIKACGLAVKP